jgi:carbon storage regulator
MLVLSRRPGEAVIIASNIRITVLAIRGNHVRLGFSAPDDETIIRSELALQPGDRPVEHTAFGDGQIARKQMRQRRRRPLFRVHPCPKDGS